MCGRYSQRFSGGNTVPGIQCALPALADRYNTCPSQQGIIIRYNDTGEQYASLATWGFLPGWMQDSGKAQINARGETVAEKPMFRAAFRKARCLVLMDGFTEWDRSIKPSQPYFVHRANDEGFAVAGIWSSRKGEDGSEVVTYALITTGPNTMMKHIHDRMPVIIDERDIKTWLEPDTDPETLKGLLAPCSDDYLTAYPISRNINSPANDSPDLLIPDVKQVSR